MQDTFNAMARSSAAVAVFGVQQVQTAAGSAVAAGIDERPSRKAANRAWESAGGIVKTTCGWRFEIVKTAAPASSGSEGR